MFCRFCGREVYDEAYVCPSCGRELRALPTEPITVPTAAPRGKGKLQKMSRIFGTLGITFNAVGFGCLLVLLLGWVLLLVSAVQPEYNEMVEACLGLGAACLYFGVLFGIIFVSFGVDFSTAAFVLGLIQKEDKALKRRSTGAFIGGLVLTAVLIFGVIGIFWFLGLASAGV